MSAIGIQSFFRMDGAVEPARTRVETLDRPGVDGAAFRDLGETAPESVLVTETLLSTLALVETTIDGYAALVGTDQTVTDGLGNSRTGVMVLDMQVVEQRQLHGAICTMTGQPTNPVAILVCRWVVRAT